MLVYAPNDPHNLLQQWPQKMSNFGVDRIEGYRFPAPGSRPEAYVPTRDNDDEIFDVKHYPNDPRNLKSTNHTYINGKEKPTLIDANSHISRRGSQNRPVNAAVKAYDPSGLRATTTATWAEMDKALAANAAPNHLVRYEWENDVEELRKECERKGIPYFEGRPMKWKQVPENFNKLKW